MTGNTAEKAYQLANEYEKTYTGCSQCVLAALHDVLNIRNDDVFKAATGLAAGGGAAIDGSCGAYSGAIMVLSTLLGRERDDFANLSGLLLENFALIRELHDKFIREYGSVVCSDIQTKVFGRPYYLADDEEFEKFEKAGAHEKHCPEVVGKAARWTVELINKAKLM
jgi:C_GCAxxG_C_C family probable redox protein